MAGVSAPNRPLRREVLVTAPLRRTIEAAITFYRPNEGWFNQTLRGEVVMGVVDPDEKPGVDQRSSWAFLRRTAELMTRKAPALADVTVIRQWAGMYDVSPDHQPLVGPTRQLDGWWQANGWSGRGMLLGPYLAELLAERFVTGVTPPRLAAFDPDRFAPDQASRGRRGRLLRPLRTALNVAEPLSRLVLESQRQPGTMISALAWASRTIVGPLPVAPGAFDR